MSEFAQYYTPSDYSEHLIGLLAQATSGKVETVFDLGAGRGELLAAARVYWPKAQLYGVDIDRGNVAAMRNRFPKARCLTADSLRFNLPSKLGLDEASADIAVANPPYGIIQTGDEVLRVLRQVELDCVVSHKRINREIVFLAQNLRLLRKGGALVAIVPEGLGSCLHYGELRAALMQKHGLFRAVALPAKTFLGTEARTLALFMNKGMVSDSLEWMSVNGDLVNLSLDQVRQRLDGDFHRLSCTTKTTLGDLLVDIRRGKISHADSRLLKRAVFHTSDFRKHSTGMARLSTELTSGVNEIAAKKGDILLARVGTRCIGQVVWVKSGHALLTDCVFRLRAQPDLQDRIYTSLRSKIGQNWLHTAAHGTCAQLISKRDLLNFPVDI